MPGRVAVERDRLLIEIVCQQQVMQIAVRMAGYSMGGIGTAALAYYIVRRPFSDDKAKICLMKKHLRSARRLTMLQTTRPARGSSTAWMRTPLASAAGCTVSTAAITTLCGW